MLQKNYSPHFEYRLLKKGESFKENGFLLLKRHDKIIVLKNRALKLLAVR